MPVTLSLVLTEDQMDLIYDALNEYVRGCPDDLIERCDDIMSEMYDQFKVQRND
jgi:hypothetical protein